jgi:hypothetical protein
MLFTLLYTTIDNILTLEFQSRNIDWYSVLDDRIIVALLIEILQICIVFIR